MPDNALPDNSVLTSAFYETNIRPQVVTTCTSATRPTGVQGRLIYETDTDRLYAYDGSGWVQVVQAGAWTAYTPTLSQGASTNISKSTNYSSYTVVGKTATFSFSLTASASGTAGSPVTLTLPVSGSATAGLAGSGYVYDSSTSTHYNGTWRGQSVSTVILRADGATSGAGWGQSPSLAVASGDELRGTITYEIA